jgi:hypothetical protein
MHEAVSKERFGVFKGQTMHDPVIRGVQSGPDGFGQLWVLGKYKQRSHIGFNRRQEA